MSVQVPKGYKQTEVGVIPEDWRTYRLGAIFKFKQGVQVPIELQTYSEYVNYLRFIRITDLTDPDTPYRYIKDPGPDDHLNLDDLFMVRYGSPGLVGIGFEGVLANNLFKIIPKIKCCIYFWFHYFESIRAEILDISSSSTMAAINFGTLNSFMVKFPSIAEQQAIAEALSDADAMIESLEQLIAKKRQIKQGTMQELLTGQRRLPGFSGEWGRKKLGEVATLSNGFAFKSSTYNSNGLFNIVTIANVQDGFMDLSHCNRIIEIPSELQSHQKLKIGDILVSMTGNVGRVCLVNEENCLLNQRVGKISCFAVNRYFLFSCLKQSDFAEKMDLQATGGAQGNISKSDILDYEINLPSAEEQAAIENLCRDFDLEIDLLAQRLDKARQIKQSMMQELLTGCIRLI